MIALLLVLTACGSGQGGSQAEQLALDIRGTYLGLAACTASMQVTADYGQRVYQYGVDLAWEREGATVLTLTAPQEVAGVTARLEEGQTALEYDGVRVETGALDQEGMSPIDALPTLLQAAREGFLAECILEDLDGARALHVTSRDPEQQPGHGREIQLWFDAATGALLRGEIAQDGYTVIQCVFSSFTMGGG